MVATVVMCEADFVGGRLPPVSAVSGTPSDHVVRQVFVWYPWWPFVAGVVPVIGIPIALFVRAFIRREWIATLPVRGDEYREVWRTQRRRDRVVSASWVACPVLVLALALATNRISALWVALPLGLIAVAVAVWAERTPGAIAVRPIGAHGQVQVRGVADAFATVVRDASLTPG